MQPISSIGPISVQLAKLGLNLAIKDGGCAQTSKANVKMQTTAAQRRRFKRCQHNWLPMIWSLCLCFSIISSSHGSQADIDTFSPKNIDRVQQHNIDILSEQLNRGWRAFCDAPVDEGVMSLFQGISPSDARLHVMTITNRSVELPIKAISELRDYDINPERKTLLYINGFHTADSYFSVQEHLALLQNTRRDLNIVIVDFAKNVAQLYYAVRHHLSVQGYFVYKVISALVEAGVAPSDITLAGHSVGANIAALGAELFSKGSKQLVGQLIAIDPATMCRTTDIIVRQGVATRVVVVHGEGDAFGVRVPLGHVDIYPNGIGYFPRRKLQPGCESKICSHMYPFILFMEALIEGVMIPATQCESWAKFRQGDCSFDNTLNIGLVYPATARGLYFCLTQPNPPFTYMEHGIRYKSLRPDQSNKVR